MRWLCLQRESMRDPCNGIFSVLSVFLSVLSTYICNKIRVTHVYTQQECMWNWRTLNKVSGCYRCQFPGLCFCAMLMPDANTVGNWVKGLHILRELFLIAASQYTIGSSWKVKKDSNMQKPSIMLFPSRDDLHVFLCIFCVSTVVTSIYTCDKIMVNLTTHMPTHTRSACKTAGLWAR